LNIAKHHDVSVVLVTIIRFLKQTLLWHTPISIQQGAWKLHSITQTPCLICY